MLFEKVVESVNYCNCYFRLMFDHYAPLRRDQATGSKWSEDASMIFCPTNQHRVFYEGKSRKEHRSAHGETAVHNATQVQNLGKLYLKTAYPRGANGRLGVISWPSNIRLPKHQKLQVSFDQEIMTAAVSFFGCMPGGATACRIMKVTYSYGIQSRHVKELKARRCTERFQTYSNNFFRNH